LNDEKPLRSILPGKCGGRHLSPAGKQLLPQEPATLEDVTLGPAATHHTAIALARQAIPVRVSAAIGNDQFGQFLRDRVLAED